MSDTTEEVKKEVEIVTEKVVAEEAKAEPVAEVKVSETAEQPPAVSAEDVKAVETDKPAEEVEPVEKKVLKVEEEVVAPAPAPVEVPVTETVEKVVDQFENMTIFGNKSLDELHKIQSKKSHLSAGTIDFAVLYLAAISNQCIIYLRNFHRNPIY